MTPQDIKILRDGAGELGVLLSEADLARFAYFADEIFRWNKKINLTALKTVAEVITKHFLDSLTVVPLLSKGASLIDIGSGGGFPSIPLKIARPDLKVVSVDSVLKKINFQRHVARQLSFSSFIAMHDRAENLASSPENRFDYVIARAVADLPMLVRLGIPLLADGGKMLAMKGSKGRAEIGLAEKTLGEMGVAVSEIVELRLPVTGDERIIVLLKR